MILLSGRGTGKWSVGVFSWIVPAVPNLARDGFGDVEPPLFPIYSACTPNRMSRSGFVLGPYASLSRGLSSFSQSWRGLGSVAGLLGTHVSGPAVRHRRPRRAAAG